LGVFYSLSLLGLMSSFNWFRFWIFLEFNTLCFIPLILKEKTKKGGEGALLYFIIQAIRSIYVLIAITREEGWVITITEPNSRIIIIAFIKIRAGFFFRWLYLLSFIFSLRILFLNLSFQKIGPFFILMLSQQYFSFFLMRTVVISAIMGVILNIKQNFIKPLIRVSSLSNTRWIILAAMYSFSIWLFYFLIYTITLRLILTINNFFLSQTYTQRKITENPLLFLSVGGIPPLPGFFPKIIVLMEMTQTKIISISLFILLLACVDIFIYLRYSYRRIFTSQSNTIFNQRYKEFLKRKILFFVIVILYANVIVMI